MEALQQNSEWMAILLKANEALSKSLDLNDTLQTLTDSASKIIEAGSAAVYLLENDVIYLGATTPPLPPGFPENLRRAPLSDHPNIQTVITGASPFVLPDAQKADLTPAEREVSEIRNLRTIVYFPLISSKKVIGVYIVGATEAPIELSKFQLTLYHTLSTQASIAIENANLYQSVQKELKERIQVERELRESKERLQNIVNNAVMGIYQVMHDGKFLLVNPRFSQMFGFNSPEEFLASVENISQLYVHPEERSSILEKIRD